MANYDVKKMEALQTSSSILTAAPKAAILRAPAALVGTGKDLLTGAEPVPRNIGEAIQLFNESIFGKPNDEFFYRSQYGMPIYSYLLIKGAEATPAQTRSQLSTLSSYRVKYTNPEGQDYTPNTWEVQNPDLTVSERSFPAIFMDSAIMTIDKKKNIVKTRVVNRDSTRKEYISSGDYTVKLSGVFTTDNDSIYPVSDVDALIRACEAPIPLDVISPYLFRFGITKLVVDSFSFPQERGSYASQKFSINFTSHNSAYSEIGAELLNENQKKHIIQKGLDSIGNLQSTVNSQIENFFTSNPF
tara:strand:- start:8584 stop:9486 length:903 start_codon:yes stop_codon:yes gene_type:complete